MQDINLNDTLISRTAHESCAKVISLVPFFFRHSMVSIAIKVHVKQNVPLAEIDTLANVAIAEITDAVNFIL
jgi:hypothetical protein